MIHTKCDIISSLSDLDIATAGQEFTCLGLTNTENVCLNSVNKSSEVGDTDRPHVTPETVLRVSEVCSLINVRVIP